MPQLSVWAPYAREQVSLVIGQDEHPMTRGERGWWESGIDAPVGARYGFRVDGGDPRPDPRSRYQPDGVHAASQVVDLDGFAWTDQSWRGFTLADAVLYELHVGTFSEPGTLDGAIDRLDHLASLGIDAVELMPLAAFPGERGWGYDGVSPFAVHQAYGGPHALQRFVDAAHARGIGVVVDVVYNHLGPSGNYLGCYVPYFTNHFNTPWGTAANLDQGGSDEVRRYFLDNAAMWLRDFHCDGLRLDAVHALLDTRALTFLEELAQETDALAAELGRPLWLVAESDRNDPATVTPRGSAGTGGLGMHAQWADDVHHAWHVFLSGEKSGYYADFACREAMERLTETPFFHDGGYSAFRGRCHGRPVDPAVTDGSRFVVSTQTHDQVGNRAIGDRLVALVGPDRAAAAALLMLTSPYVPMLWMGEEWGAGTPWLYFTDHAEEALGIAIREGRRREFAEHGWEDVVPDPQDRRSMTDSRLDWSEVCRGDHELLLQWYTDLIHLRKKLPDLRDHALVPGATTLDEGFLVVRRGRCTVVVNLRTEEHAVDADGDVLAGWGPVRADRGRVVLGPGASCVVGPTDAVR